jgi:hypothetical protein
MKTKELIETALSLPLEERVILIDSLLASLNFMDSSTEREWKKIAHQRLDELLNGDVQGLPAEEVIQRVSERMK